MANKARYALSVAAMVACALAFMCVVHLSGPGGKPRHVHNSDDGGSTTTTTTTTTTTSEAGEGVCDPLVPQNCLMPWPNTFFTRDDPSSSTGLRLNLSMAGMPTTLLGGAIDPDVGGWNALDGFSAAGAIMSYWPRLSLANVVSHQNIAASVDMDLDSGADGVTSTTVLLEVSTGTLVPHFCELDMSNADAGDERAFMCWPAIALKHGTRYIVAMFDLVSEDDGLPYAPSDAFAALVSKDYDYPDVDVTSRIDYFDSDIFYVLEDVVSLSRYRLQLAWDFTTGSSESITGPLVAMRDDALSRIDADGISYEIETVTDYALDQSNGTYRRIQGAMQVPLYLDSPAPGSVLVLDADGTPVYQTMAAARFEISIPWSVVTSGVPGRILVIGHGLFNTEAEIRDDYLQAMSNEYGYILCATTFWGLSKFDQAAVYDIMFTDLTSFRSVPDRNMQSVVNFAVLTRLMLGPMTSDANTVVNGVPTVSGESAWYFGSSQGGILGQVVMATQTDITRGVLGVGGGPYTLLLPRSTDFSDMFTIIQAEFTDPIDQMMLLSIVQLLWDRADPGGYMQHTTTDLLPDTPAHSVIVQYGLGDSGDSWLGLLMQARSMACTMFPNNVREYDEILYGFGVEDSVGPSSSSLCGVQGYNFSAPYAPQTNVPPCCATDTHQCTRRDPRAHDQMWQFFTTGVIADACDGGGCHPYAGLDLGPTCCTLIGTCDSCDAVSFAV